MDEDFNKKTIFMQVYTYTHIGIYRQQNFNTFDTLLTLYLSRRAAITGEVSVKPYPFCTFTPIACTL